ncbi:MAG TPA: hypothetical protein PKM67_03955 [Kiritimatiellia bacterium]|nr:hypothetical protein [Kiritimatiellia bacterium]HNS80591.1 hypothetical protein [Kiritimatiellia bacterium]
MGHKVRGAMVEENSGSDKTAAFMELVRFINTAIRNSAMYPAGHPMLADSLKSLKAALDGWLGSEGKLDMAFTRSAVLVGGKPFKEGNPVLAGLARHFHQRGLLALTIRPGVVASEVSSLLAAIKDPPEIIARSGGVSSRLRRCPHLSAKQIDYSTLLTRSVDAAGGGRDIDIVQLLCDADKRARAGFPSAAVIEEICAALAGGRKFSAAINEIFTSPGGHRGEAAKNLWRVMGRVVRFCKDLPPEKAARTLRHLSTVLAGLNPEALDALFSEQAAEEGVDDLQKAALPAVPDAALSEMISSHITREGKVDSSLMSLFLRLSDRAGASPDLAQSVAGKLSGLDHDRLATVQGALEDALKTAARNEFMSQVYQLTMNTLAEKERQTIQTDAAVAALVANFQLMCEKNRAQDEKVRLLLNILWFEENPRTFREFSGRLLDELPRCSKNTRPEMTRDALKVFWEKTCPGVDPAIAREAVSSLYRLGPLAGSEALAALIPGSSPSQIEEIAHLLSETYADGGKALLNLAINRERGPAGNEICAALAAMKLSDEQAADLAKKAVREKDPAVRRVYLCVLAGSGDQTVIGRLFRFLRGGVFSHRILLELIDICGQGKIAASVPFLSGLLKHHTLPMPGRLGIVEAVVESLCRIHTSAAAAVLQKTIQEGNRNVQRACRRVMPLTGARRGPAA